jgi:MFS family permease
MLLKNSHLQPKTLKVLLLAYTSLLLLGLCDNIRGPLFPEILKEFSVSDTQGSLFFSMSSVFGFFGGFFSNLVIDRWGSLKALRISFAALFIGQLMLSIATSFWFLIFGIFFFGYSLGLMGVIQNMLVVQEIATGPLKNRILSGLHSMYAGSSLIAPLLVTFVAWARPPFDVWRFCFVLGALFCVVIYALTFWGPPLNEKMKSPQERVPPTQDRAAQIYFAVILSSYVLAEILVSSRMALLMRREYHSDLTQSSWYTAGFFVSLLVSRMLFAIWSPRISIKAQLLASLGLAMTSLLVGLYIHPIGLALSGFFMGPFYPLMMVQLGQLFHRSVSQAISWAVSLSSLFVVVMHMWVGWMTDIWGLKIAFLMGPLFCLLSIVMIGIYEKVFRRLQHSF